MRAKGLASGNKFITNQAPKTEERKKEDQSDDEEEDYKPKKGAGPKKSVAGSGDLEPSMIGKKRVLGLQKKDLAPQQSGSSAQFSDENKNAANKMTARSRSASRVSGKEEHAATNQKQKKVK